MTMQPIDSQMLSAAGYDADSQQLAVTFTSGGTYTYSGVPQGVYDDLMASPSKGRYFLASVKGKYPFTQ